MLTRTMQNDCQVLVFLFTNYVIEMYCALYDSNEIGDKFQERELASTPTPLYGIRE